ncbi:alpha/beta fold hydrolase [Mitsuaria sp. GD03876]|uniref:YheT family hydrolase n=1 Tax=Mitsuaria sp. GD03876 TaxID=2975399 RepID=UPI00244D4A1B|nr:alpha/beta fold hydrolase [Mitsuaria sp. GD03876]MDH0862903.1 alpha/beta fold hydrolase [Mitsuaria sp. GD03876]
MQYQAPPWLPGGHAQTIWPALFARRFDGSPPRFRRERWETPDGDFVDVEHLVDDAPAPGAHPSSHSSASPSAAGAERPLLVLFHGLEGSVESQYVQAFAAVARRRGWAFAMPYFRGCSGELNLAPRAYHSGDYVEIGWMLAQLRAMHRGPIVAAGVSLGGNALLRWAQEAGESAAATVKAVCSICSPIDLTAAGHAIGQGFNKLVYTRMFLRTMVPKALNKLKQHPGLFDGERLRRVRNLYEFDNIFTGPLHGFRDVDDYWLRASAKPHLARIRVPALVLNARNDPFVPARSLPAQGHVGPHVTLWQPRDGGHVGFPSGRPPGHVRTMPERVTDWLAMRL